MRGSRYWFSYAGFDWVSWTSRWRHLSWVPQETTHLMMLSGISPSWHIPTLNVLWGHVQFDSLTNLGESEVTMWRCPGKPTCTFASLVTHAVLLRCGGHLMLCAGCREKDLRHEMLLLNFCSHQYHNSVCPLPDRVLVSGLIQRDCEPRFRFWVPTASTAFIGILKNVVRGC